MMKKKIYLNPIISACLFLTLYACGQAGDKKNAGTMVMDPVSEIPEWLKTTVDNALPYDTLNIWIPTNDLASSSLIRVPRFPSLKRENDTVPSPFDIQPVDPSAIHMISGVRNEQRSFQIAVASKKNLSGLWAHLTDLVSERGDTLSARHIQIRYVRYVPVQRARSELIWTARPEEVYGREVSGTGSPDVVADPLMDLPAVDVPPYRAQPLWFTVQIPPTLSPGIYRGAITIHTGRYTDVSLPLAVHVLEPILPVPADYRFFLDLWFNPNAIAVAGGLELWSEAHWAQVDAYLEDLASRGAKTVTTTIVPYPWKVGWLGGISRPQTYAGYPEMVVWLRDSTGRWSFDYSVFDRFVEACFAHRIDRRIDAFSLTPFEHKGGWQVYFRHKEDNTPGTLSFHASDEGYKEIWKIFLRDFENHLKEKGWLEKTYLSFDESPREIIEAVVDMVAGSAPGFLERFSIAGKIDTESLAASLSLFYSGLPGQAAEKDGTLSILKKRKTDPRKTTTYYLCGDPAHPNSFTFSPSIESRMIPWLAAYYNLDGYLRWAYNSWPDKDPYNNPVFNFIQGDDHYIYPGIAGPVSSIRWELLREGIQDYELLMLSGSPKGKEEAVELAVRNRDGRKKSVRDFEEAREILLEGFFSK